MTEQKKLQMTFDPNTIEHLGVRMYSTLPPVLAELIANAYDAYAENVNLILKDKEGEKEIIIEDDGVGMSFDEINEKFLKIGRNRRQEQEIIPKGKKERKIIGKKGLGKLSFFGIAEEIEIATVKDGKETVFVMSWERIKSTASQNYTPEIKKSETPCSKDKGTKIILRKIQRKTGFDPKQLAVSISRIIIFSDDFKVTVKHNNENPVTISNNMRYESLDKECEWAIPLINNNEKFNKYLKNQKVKGHLIATEKPIKPKTGMRGVSLFSRTKLVNRAEYFSNSNSSNFFSYLTGYLEVDFIDELEDDVISTDRQSLNRDHEKISELRDYLRNLIDFLERDWRKKRKKIRGEKLKEKTGIDIPDWFAKLPDEYKIKESVEFITNEIVENSELPEEKQKRTVEKLHRLIPAYPIYHWRHLHPEIRDASKEKYRNEDYYGAFQEAVKRYEEKVREKSGLSDSTGTSLMGKIFGKDKDSVLSVTKNFKKPDGSTFQPNTTDSIEEGQKFLSMGVIAGCRNPIAHEELVNLKKSGLFTEKDCLDALSLLSHLFGRLDNAEKKSKKE